MALLNRRVFRRIPYSYEANLFRFQESCYTAVKADRTAYGSGYCAGQLGNVIWPRLGHHEHLNETGPAPREQGWPSQRDPSARSVLANQLIRRQAVDGTSDRPAHATAPAEAPTLIQQSRDEHIGVEHSPHRITPHGWRAQFTASTTSDSSMPNAASRRQTASATPACSTISLGRVSWFLLVRLATTMTNRLMP